MTVKTERGMKYLVLIPLAVVGWFLGLWLNEWTRRHGHP